MELIQEQYDDEFYFDVLLNKRNLEDILDGGMVSLEETVDGITYNICVRIHED